jgi:hypothetical protein
MDERHMEKEGKNSNFKGWEIEIEFFYFCFVFWNCNFIIRNSKARRANKASN